MDAPPSVDAPGTGSEDLHLLDAEKETGELVDVRMPPGGRGEDAEAVDSDGVDGGRDPPVQMPLKRAIPIRHHVIGLGVVIPTSHAPNFRFVLDSLRRAHHPALLLPHRHLYRHCAVAFPLSGHFRDTQGR